MKRKKTIMKRIMSVFLCLTLAAGGFFGTAVSVKAETASDTTAANDTVVETVTIPHTQTTGESNYFTYSATGWSAMGQSSEHVWSDTPSADNPEAIWYEVKFVGHKIEIYSGKNHPMGMVEYFIDGVSQGKYSLYNSSNINSTYITAFENLTEGEHTFKAVATGERDTNSTNTLIDCAKVIVHHAPYKVKSITLTTDNITLTEGAEKQIEYTVSPGYASLTDAVYTSSDKAVADVDENGLISAVGEGNAVITLSSESSGISVTMNVKVNEAVAGIAGSIVDTDTQWTQDRYDEVKTLGIASSSLSAWKNDRAVSEIALASVDSKLDNVTVTASDFVSGTNKIAAENITATFIKSTKAYNGDYLGYLSTTREIPEDNGTNRSETSDILYQTAPIDIAYNSVQPVWVEIAIPKDAAAGTYTGTLAVTADELEGALEFTYEVTVYDAVLPDATEFADGFDVELWQYPYSSAEYYGVTPFSDDHYAIMESSMGIYKEIGGHAITTSIVEEAWSGQTYSANEVHYPSMVKWNKQSDGSFTWDYTDFDKWVQFNKDLGIGDKIVLYSIAPWNNSIGYWQNGRLTYQSFNLSNTSDQDIWKAFIADLIDHLEEKGWFDDAYMGIDERGFSATAFDLIESVTNDEGECLKTAGAMDHFVDKWNLALRVTDLNVGDTAAAANPGRFAELIAAREAKGYRTTLYSCTEHRPGQFSLSAPVESYWIILNAAKMGTAGFLRWAYDAWTADPLNDTTHNSYEPGDCFLIFPDEKDAEDPTSKYSVRLARIAEGVRDANKLFVMEKEYPELASSIDKALNSIQYQLVINNSSYLSDADVQTLAEETNSFKEKLNEVTEKYLILKAGGTLEEDKVVVDEAKQVAYYSFGNVTGTALKDEWGSHDGTISGSAATADGKAGKALSVTTAGEGAVIADYSELDQGDWTVAYWVNTSADFSGEISVTEDSTQKFSTSLKMASDRDSGFRVGDNSSDVLTYGYPFAKDIWYHVAWVQDKSTGLSLYVNGTLVKNNTWTSGNDVNAPVEVIGGNGFTGLIDEVKIYNAVLTAEEIASIMEIPGINLTESSAEIYLEDTYQIRATVVSDNSNKTITYESADPTIASVDEKGLVTGLKRGKTTITLRNEATGYEAVFTIKVSVEISILNELPLYILDEEYLSDVEGPYPDDAAMRYLGQPDTIRTDTGRLITVFPVGHGHGPLIMKYSDDEGATWTEMPNTPASWDDSQETPTLYSLRMEDGSERLVLICACPGRWGNYTTGWDFSYSDDNGETWTEFEKFWSTFSDGKKNEVIVGMASLVQLKDKDGNYIQKWMGVYHDFDYVNYKTYLTFNENGEPQWTEPVPYLSEYRAIEDSHWICEVGLFRSPDGERIVGLARNQTHAGPATMFYSDDEGETWSEPVELPGSLAGERHKVKYDPISGRLVITFREIVYDRNDDGVFSGGSDWIAGDWVAWVGTYDDLMNLQQGDYMIRLDEDFANNYYSGDCGYTGMVVLDDGTFVFHSYGHWDEEFSKNYTDGGSYNVKTDLCWIRQAKFSLADVENDNNLIDYSELEKAIEACKIISDVVYTEESFALYEAALEKAEAMNEARNVQQIQVDAMVVELRNAHKGLEADTVTPTPDVTPTPGVKPTPNVTPTPGAKPTPNVTPAPAKKNPFKDVTKDYYFYDEVLWAVENGITTGVSDDMFAPFDNTTRGNVVTFLWRAAGSPEPETKTCPFTDVEDYAYYYKAVLWAAENNITTGVSATTFAPDDLCTRGQIVTLLWRMQDEPDAKTTKCPFADVPDYAYYYDAVLWAFENNITTGKTATTFGPDEPCIRGDFVTFLYRVKN